jgi:hypothetical protein
MGVIKTPIRDNNASNGKIISTRSKITEPESYALFRIVYKL